jgi:ribosome-binding protein aMBF1 (putative translation factor)
MDQMTQRPLRTGGRAWGPERVALGLSLRELARLSGIDKAILSMAENGRLIPSGLEYQAVEAALRKVRDSGSPA